MELDQRLGLYQIFLRLYEHNRSLLDEILNLEDSETPLLAGTQLRYVQGVIQVPQVYLVTNFLDDRTQSLFQSEGVWVVGRDRTNALPIQDKRLSRRHAAIHYIDGQGFYLVDLNSTNGSFVNGEPIKQCILLKDGDRVRLGSLAFSFFTSQGCRTLPVTPVELMAILEKNKRNAVLPTASAAGDRAKPEDEDPVAASASDAGDSDVTERTFAGPHDEKDTDLFLRPKGFGEKAAELAQLPHLNPKQRADILDRFLDRQTSAERDPNV